MFLPLKSLLKYSIFAKMHPSQYLLKKYWGYESFRGIQENAIKSILSGTDTLIIMPTGGGKSLCYQIPALMAKGICIVISPLIALMKDQVQQLSKKGIPAAALYSGQNNLESRELYRQALDETIKLLYVSPERLQSERFQRFLTQANVSFIAVDEAHCIAQWGHDFRPAYLRIKELRYTLPKVPILALTATATQKVAEEITQQLNFKNGKIIQDTFLREELGLHVKKVENKESILKALLQDVDRSAIVYCRSRKSCRDLASLLQQAGLSATYYHAGLKKEERDRAQNDWLKNNCKVIVCTNAFGMGIDKPDVGMVIHYDLPENLEAYYQEVGRAGRDGKYAQGILLYTESSIQKHRDMLALKFPAEEQLRQLYNEVCNYLKIPVGAGTGEYFDFDLYAFLNTTKLNAYTAWHGIQLLAKQNIWHLSESVHVPIRIQILASNEDLKHLATQYHRQDALIKQLLRMYSGIWHHPVGMNEYDLASTLKQPVQQIIQDLLFLAARQYIELIPKRDKPQLYFTDQRYPAEQIVLHYDDILWHKQREQDRSNALIHYVRNTTTCRMKMLAQYFGQQSPVCGKCDVDQVKHIPLSLTSVKEYIDHALLNQQEVQINHIVHHWPIDVQEHVLQHIRHLIQAGSYKVNSLGALCLAS